MFQCSVINFVVMGWILVVRIVVMVTIGGVHVHCRERLLQLIG